MKKNETAATVEPSTKTVEAPAFSTLKYAGIIVNLVAIASVMETVSREMGRIRKAMETPWQTAPTELKRLVQSTVHGTIEIEKNAQVIAWMVQNGHLTPEQGAIAELDRKLVRFAQAGKNIA